MKIKSLTLRISIVVTVMTLFVLLATLFTVYVTAINNHKKEAAEETHYKLDLLVERLSKVQTAIELTANNSVPALQERLTDTLVVKNILNNIVKTNPYVNGAALAYAPNRLPGRPYFMPIAVNYGIINQYFSDKELNGDYIYDDWYIAPSLDGIAFWTDPYINMLHVPVISYAVPVVSQEHGFEGVLTLAVDLSKLSKLLASSQSDDADSLHHGHGRNIILDRNTTFLAMPKKQYIMKETLFTLAESTGDTINSYIGREILAGRNGEEILTIDGEKSVISWRVLPKLDWTAMVITPYSEVYAAVNTMTYITIIVALLAAISAIVILYFSVRRALRPFKRLKSATHMLGEGRYDVQLPYHLTDRADEIGDLSREFMRMETAVKQNIDQLEDSRLRLKRSNEMLATLMHNVVSHLRIPVNNMLNYNDALAMMASDNEDAQAIKNDAEQAGQTILQQFRQLNELTDLISSDTEDAATMIVMPSNDFVDGVRTGAHQLEERFMLSVRDGACDTRSINIRSNPHVLERLIFQLIIESSQVSKTTEIGLSFLLNDDQSALRVLMEAKTPTPIPEAEKPTFFKRFAEEKINAYATSEYLPLYICYRIAKRLDVRIYVEPTTTKDELSNIFVLEIPKTEMEPK